MRKLLIVGIDPGTTTGYAVYDINGNFLKVSSGRNIPNHSLISDILSIGRAVVISCDVHPPSKSAASTAKKLGAVLLAPEKSLSLCKKARLVDDWLKKQECFIKISNKHERDAMASALFAYKKARKLFDRVSEDFGKGEISDTAKERVLKEKIAIKKVMGNAYD